MGRRIRPITSPLTPDPSRVWRSVPHLGAGSIGAGTDEPEANRRSAVRTLGAHGFFIEQFVLIFLEPHELETLRAAAYLRCHRFPRTLGPVIASQFEGDNLVQDARQPQGRCYLFRKKRSRSGAASSAISPGPLG